MYPDSLKKLIENLKRLPGVGDKTAERFAFSIINLEEEDVKSFADSMLEIKEKIMPCKICGTLTDKEVCDICSDKTRNSSVLVVVCDSREVFMLEKVGTFNGYYHVLGGLISPLDDIGPEDISINKLISRIKEGNFKEVVLAIKSGIEADTTALYIKRLLEKDDVVVSRIATGIPMGADMEYVDALTLDSAIKNRKEVLD